MASLISLSNTCLILPLFHLLRAQHHTSRRRGLQLLPRQTATQALNVGLLQALPFCAAGTGPRCHRQAPEVQTGAPGSLLVTPQSLGPAGHAAPGLTAHCQPDTLSHSSHLCATSITGIQRVSQPPPATFTWHPHSSPTTTSSDTRRGHGPRLWLVFLTKEGHQNPLPTVCQAILHIKPSFLQDPEGIWLCLCTPPLQRWLHEDDDTFTLQTQSCAFLSKSVQIVLTSF